MELTNLNIFCILSKLDNYVKRIDINYEYIYLLGDFICLNISDKRIDKDIVNKLINDKNNALLIPNYSFGKYSSNFLLDMIPLLHKIIKPTTVTFLGLEINLSEYDDIYEPKYQTIVNDKIDICIEYLDKFQDQGYIINPNPKLINDWELKYDDFFDCYYCSWDDPRIYNYYNNLYNFINRGNINSIIILCKEEIYKDVKEKFPEYTIDYNLTECITIMNYLNLRLAFKIVNFIEDKYINLIF